MLNDKRILYSILDGMPMSVYLKDLAGKITYFNKYAKKFLGITKSKNMIKNSFIKSNMERIKETDNEVINNKSTIEIEEEIKIQNSGTKWYNIHKYPVFDDNNNMAGICVIARDVEIEKKIQEQRETYIATLTHDLQNPTLAQINALNLLLEEKLGPLNEEQRNIIHLTKDSCSYMLEMLLSLLDTYKFENGDYTLDIMPCDIKKLIEDTNERYVHLLKDKNITVDISINTETKDFVSDELFLRRILNNLCRFIINYSYKDTTIKISLDRDGDFFKFEFKSCGYHIPPKTLNSLFEKYTTHFSKYNTVGVDICLYHSKQIVSALGGNVIIKSCDTTNIVELTLPIKPITDEKGKE